MKKLPPMTAKQRNALGYHAAVIAVTDDEGWTWNYHEGSTRIIGSQTEINIWDHASGQPGIEFTVEAITARIDEWRRDEREADEGPSENAEAEFSATKEES